MGYKMIVLDNNPTKYSAVISKCAGCDPGPLVDFYSNNFYFKNVSPGRWYVNVKKEINGYWSNIVYWTIDVPEWQEPTLTPTPTTLLVNSNSDNLTENNTNYSLQIALVVGVLIGVFVSLFVNKQNKQNE
jgi:hypothetical protein